MADLAQYTETVQGAIADTVQDFKFHATTVDDVALEVPFTYMINEPDFGRPFELGKGSPDEIRGEMDRVIAEAAKRGIDVGIEGHDSVRKLALQLGLGVDCSNFACRALTLVHERLGLEPYAQWVFMDSARVLELNSTKPSWRAKEDDGTHRDLTVREILKLSSLVQVDLAWVKSVFHNDVEFNAGAHQIGSEPAAFSVELVDLLPGDLVTFKNVSGTRVSHLGVISDVRQTNSGATHIEFEHSWHTRDYDSGMRKDEATISADGKASWSHKGLEDPRRYSSFSFARPAQMMLASMELR